MPQYHAYYTDHLIRPEAHDLLLLLECCRQAATYGGYVHYRNAADTINLVNELEIELTEPEALVIGARPAELTMRVDVVDKVLGGARRRGTPVVEMFIGGVSVGRARIRATVVKQATFRALRRRHRGSEPPSTHALPEVPDGVPVAPHRVGRENPTNVVLTDALLDGDVATARLGLLRRNRSILDHEYDHFPAMSLVEGARQVALLAMEGVSGGVEGAAARMRATRLRASFVRFAELDSPLTLLARPVDGGAARDGAGGPHGAITFDVECVQDGQPLATAEVTLTPAGPPNVSVR